MDLNLGKRTALVCGASQGIGLAAAVELAGLGANIVLVARNKDRLQAAVGQLPQPESQEHSFLVADFSKPQQLKTVISDWTCLLYTSPSPRDRTRSRMPSSA